MPEPLLEQMQKRLEGLELPCQPLVSSLRALLGEHGGKTPNRNRG